VRSQSKRLSRTLAFEGRDGPREPAHERSPVWFGLNYRARYPKGHHLHMA
jgi:hypothetical protein